MTRILALISAAVVAAALVGFYVAPRFLGAGGDRFADCRGTAVAGGAAAVGGPFALTDPAGRRVTEAEAITGPTLVYFGYTYCPDVCPVDLSRNALAAAELAERGEEVGQVFISIDPARDTPEVVGEYVAAIDPAILGLTGTPEEVAVAARAYKVYYAKAGDDPESYLMDHSTFTYLMAPDAGFLEFFRSDATPEAVADAVACFTGKI